MSAVRALFLTHLHSDHTIDYANLLLFGLFAGLDRTPRPLKVFDPSRCGQMEPVFSAAGEESIETPIVCPENPFPGGRDMTEHLFMAYATDLNDRIRDNGKPDFRTLVDAHDIDMPDVQGFLSPNETPARDMAPFKVYEDDRVKVTATLVNHFPVWPAFAYRFDSDDGSIVFSGDTCRCDNLIRLAQGDDILVHETIVTTWAEALFPKPRTAAEEGLQNHLLSAHTPVEEVGAVAEAVGGRRRDAGAEPHRARQCHPRAAPAGAARLFWAARDRTRPDADRGLPNSSFRVTLSETICRRLHQMESREMSGPLAGLKVLDIATIIAAPLAATLLADYGAEVLKVEMPGQGDGVRYFPPFKEGKPLWWKTANRNKKFATLDLRTPEGLALFKRLLPKFDVLIENFRPGTLDRWGLTKEVLWEIQPRLVILRATGFGQDGPYRDKPGFARIFEAMGGLTYITGEPDGEPMHPGYPIGDAIGGLFGTVGVLAALWKRARDPNAPGEEIDLALTEATFRLLDVLPIEFDQLGVVRNRIGNSNGYSAPAAVYRTKDDRWVTLAGSTNPLYAANCRAIGRPELIDDPRFANNAQRVEHSGELNAIFSAWCAAHTLDEALAAFGKEQGTIAPIYSIDQIAADPQAQARKVITRAPDKDFGEVAMANVVPRFSHDPGSVRSTAGDIGQDNAEVFGRWLGLSVNEMSELARKKVI